MKKLLTITLTAVVLISCEIYFPHALSSHFVCKNRICKNNNYNKKLPIINFKTSKSENVIYVDKNIEINSSDIGEIIITKPNITITFKAPYTQNSLTNIQKIKSITDNTGSVTLIFKGGDYYIEDIKISDDERMSSFKVCKTNLRFKHQITVEFL